MDHQQIFLTPASRLTLAVVGIGLIMLLLVARSLSPDPRGLGTHEQLGLTPCSFYRWTGHACPTCGMTTAWTYAWQGDWAAAARTNLAGLLLWCIAVMSVPWMIMSAGMGRWLIARPTARALVLAGTGLMTIAVLDWLRRWWIS